MKPLAGWPNEVPDSIGKSPAEPAGLTIPLMDSQGRELGAFRISAGVGEARAFTRWDKELAEAAAVVASVLIDIQRLENRRVQNLESVQHELRTPAVGIRGNAGYLRGRLAKARERQGNPRKTDELEGQQRSDFFQFLASEKLVRKLEDIEESAKSLLKVLENLDLSERHRLDLDPETVWFFRDIVLKGVYEMKPLLKKAGLPSQGIVLDPSLRNLQPVTVDRATISQVVFNLLTNAARYATPEKSSFRVLIRVESQHDYWTCFFEDNGIGVPRDAIDRIFEKHYRAPNAVGRDAHGSGIGLFVARQIARAHGGDLTLRSPAGPTTFALRMPWRPEALDG